jgi:hypothetical protein
VRRTADGVVLNTGAGIALADVDVITTPPPPKPEREAKLSSEPYGVAAEEIR